MRAFRISKTQRFYCACRPDTIPNVARNPVGVLALFQTRLGSAGPFGRVTMKSKTRHFVFLLSIIVVVSAIPLFAQTFGEIAGHISDRTGASVPGARMILTNIATNAVRTTLSTQSGDYTFPAVAPGFYNVRLEQPSFKAASSTRSRMVTSVLYEMPVGRGRAIDIKNRVANAVIGGWQTGGTLTLQSGMPTTLGIGGIDNASTAAGGYDRPNSSGISPCLDHPTLSRYWNLGALSKRLPDSYSWV